MDGEKASARAAAASLKLCARCGAAVPLEALRHSCIPPLQGAVAVGLSDIDEPEPLPLASFLDGRRYCTRCRLRINLRRACACVMAVTVLAGMVYCILR
jgi:hypothetical protein